MKDTCEKCLWFGSAILCCFHPDNEGSRAFPNMAACNHFRNYEDGPMTDEEKNKFMKMLFCDDKEDNCL